MLAAGPDHVGGPDDAALSCDDAAMQDQILDPAGHGRSGTGPSRQHRTLIHALRVVGIEDDAAAAPLQHVDVRRDRDAFDHRQVIATLRHTLSQPPLDTPGVNLIDAGKRAWPEQPACGLEAVPFRALPKRQRRPLANALNRLGSLLHADRYDIDRSQRSQGPNVLPVAQRSSAVRPMRPVAREHDRGHEAISSSRSAIWSRDGCAAAPDAALRNADGARQLRQHARPCKRLHCSRVRKECVRSTLLPGLEDGADPRRNLIGRVVVGSHADRVLGEQPAHGGSWRCNRENRPSGVHVVREF